MQESQTQPQSPVVAVKPHEGDKVMQDALAARAEGIHELTQAREKLGQVAVEGPVFDASGVYLTPRERETERAHVQLHGHGSNETATGH